MKLEETTNAAYNDKMGKEMWRWFKSPHLTPINIPLGQKMKALNEWFGWFS